MNRTLQKIQHKNNDDLLDIFAKTLDTSFIRLIDMTKRTTINPDTMKFFIIEPSEFELEAAANGIGNANYTIGLRYGAPASGEPYVWFYLNHDFADRAEAETLLTRIGEYGSIKLPENCPSPVDSNWKNCTTHGWMTMYTVFESFDATFPTEDKSGRVGLYSPSAYNYSH